MSGCVSRVADRQTQIMISTTDINLGKLKYNKPIQTEIRIENSGANPLLIFNVKSSCGCTIPQWTKEPIKPNEFGIVNITYDSKLPGKFNKSIIIFYNGCNSPDTISIHGEVEWSENF